MGGRPGSPPGPPGGRPALSAPSAPPDPGRTPDRPAAAGGLPHLVAAGLAAAVLALGLLGMALVAGREARHHAAAFAARPAGQAAQGRALPRAALARSDLLVLYGSSELQENHFEGNAVLRAERAGFLLFPVGKGGTTSLALAQYLAGVGEALRGRQVAVSISPQWFVWRLAVAADQYRGSFSRLHAHELVFSTRLDWTLRRDVARRMRDHPETLRRDPVLWLGVRHLARGGWPDRLVLAALWPLAALDRLVLRLQDDWETLRLIRRRGGGERAVEPAVGPVNWDRALADAAAAVDAERAEQQARWLAQPRERLLARQRAGERSRRRAEPDPGSEGFLDRVRRSAEWGDLDLLLRVLAALGARPLLIGMPLNGAYYDAVGVPRAVRDAYYDRLRGAVAARGLPLVDLSGHDGDARFLRDFGGHPTAVGWVHYARALDGLRRAGP